MRFQTLVFVILGLSTLVTLNCNCNKEDCSLGAIEIQIFDENQSPLSGVTVSIVGVGDALTGDNGQSVFEMVQSGTYEITFAKDQYELMETPNTGTITIGCDRTTSVFIMKPIGPILSVSRTLIDFSDDETIETINISNAGTGNFSWEVQKGEGAEWIIFDGAEEGEVENNITPLTIKVDRARLSSGLNEGQFIVKAGEAGEAVITVKVDNMSPFEINPQSLDFGTTETTRSFDIILIKPLSVNYNVSSDKPWIRINREQGTLSSSNNTDNVIVTVDRNAFDNFGPDNGKVIVKGNGFSQEAFIIAEKLDPTAPILTVFPKSLNFNESADQVTLSVSNTGIRDLIWQIESAPIWLNWDVSNYPIISGGGLNTHRISFSVDRTGLESRTYSGEIILTSNASSVAVPVTLRVNIDNSRLALGRIAYYSFNGNANSTTRSGEVNAFGTVSGAELSTDRNGQIESAYCFDGVDGYIGIINPITGGSSVQYSISFWMKNFSISSQKKHILFLRGPSYFDLYMENGNLNFGAYFDPRGSFNNFWEIATAENIISGNWIHIIGVYNRVQGGQYFIEIYVNGELQGRNSYTSPGNLGEAPNLSSFIGTNSQFDSFWEGCIDDLRIYDRALNQNEINDLYCLDNSSSACN